MKLSGKEPSIPCILRSYFIFQQLKNITNTAEKILTIFLAFKLWFYPIIENSIFKELEPLLHRYANISQYFWKHLLTEGISIFL